MISHKHKFIFSHIPKAGGTTIERYLHAHASESVGEPFAKTEKIYRNKELFKIIDDHPTYFKFTFCRNPYTRLLSCYLHLAKHSMTFIEFVHATKKFIEYNPGEYYKKILHNSTIFSFWREDAHELSHLNFRIKDTEHLSECFGDNGLLGYHVLPQVYFLNGEDFHIGRVENMQADFSEVCNLIGIPPPDVLKARRKQEYDPEDYYNEDLRSIVKDIYKEDFKYFKYDE